MKENGIQYGKITVTGAAGRRGKEQGMKENGVIQEYTGSLSRQIREEYHIGEDGFWRARSSGVCAIATAPV